MIGKSNLHVPTAMTTLLLLLLGLCETSEAGTFTGQLSMKELLYQDFFPYSSCKRIQLASPTAGSGEYSIRTSKSKILCKVYCEMGLNGGGYTFIRPSDIPRLTAAELQAIFTDRRSFLLRVRQTDGNQPYGVLSQLPQYSNIPLYLNHSSNPGYSTPVNVAYLGNQYLYYGFLPITSSSTTGTTQGIQVNGVSIPFVSCDGSPNSYFALFPNFNESAPTSYAFETSFPMYDSIVAALRQNPSRRVIPDEYFMFFEIHFGGCGLYTQADARQNSKGIISAAIGFR